MGNGYLGFGATLFLLYSDFPIRANGLDPNGISQIEQGEAVELIGDFEYSNVFGEYCRICISRLETKPIGNIYDLAHIYRCWK